MRWRKLNKSRVEKINFYSEILCKEMAVNVYLPECYSEGKAVPVLYFFHGRSGNEDIIFHINMNEVADSMIESKEINPMIIVCPRIENSRGLNSSLKYKEVFDSKEKNRVINLGMYEDYFIKEVIPLIDKNFNTIQDKEGKYIGGASAGGYIALHNAFRHKNMFSKVGGHMPALELKLEEEDKAYFESMDIWEKYDPIYIVKNNEVSPNIKVYLDAGHKDEGRFYEGCLTLYEVLKEKGIDAENHVFPGNHSVEYIKSNIEKYLKFYGA